MSTARKKSREKHVLRIELKPAEGGSDAALFVQDLERALQKYFTKQDVKILEKNSKNRETVFHVQTESKERRVLEKLSGIHRVQRIPPTEKNGRRHTSSVLVVVLRQNPTERKTLDDKQIVFETFKASGPGGQHRNKTMSAVRVRDLESGVVVTSSRSRSQHSNKAKAYTTLQERLANEEITQAKKQENRQRTAQIDTGKAWDYNHNAQRNESVRRKGGKTSMKKFLNGNLEFNG